MWTSSGSSSNSSEKRFRRGLETSAKVEPHGVLRRRRRDDHVGVTGRAGDLLQLLTQSAADASGTPRCADVEERQLCDPGPEVRHDDTYADHAAVSERTERNPAAVEVVLNLPHLGLDGVLALTVRIPGRRTPLAVACDEPRALLVVEHFDSFRAVDLADA
jgi:hypothetical protein